MGSTVFAWLKRSTVVFPICLSVIITVVLTFPLTFNLDKWLLLSNGGWNPRIDDQFIFVKYLAAMKYAFLHGISPWGVILYNPNFAMPPTYAFLGGFLSLVVEPIVAHNILLLLFVFLAPFVMFFYAKYMTRSTLAATLAAIIFGSCNHLIHHVVDGHGNLIQIYWIPAVFWAVEIVLNRPTLKAGMILGLCCGFVVMSCAQFALCMAVLLPIYYVCRKPGIIVGVAQVKAISISAIVAIATSGYYIYLKYSILPRTYSLKANLVYSVRDTSDFINTNSSVYLGVIPSALALISVVYIFRKQQHHMLPLAVIGLMSFVFAFGPFHELSPYMTLHKVVPYFDHVRTPMRFYPFLLVSVALLSSYSLVWLANGLRKWQRGTVVLCVLGAILLMHHIDCVYSVRTKSGKGIWTHSTVKERGMARWTPEFTFDTL